MLLGDFRFRVRLMPLVPFPSMRKEEFSKRIQIMDGVFVPKREQWVLGEPKEVVAAHLFY
jgi:hypothetical protein